MLHFYWLGTFLLKNPLKHVELLDYLRGIAILAVLLCHTFAIVYGYDRIPWNGWVRNFSVSPFAFLCAFPISLGQAGVAMFFVVSGFCIHMSFQKQGQRWGSFFIRRIFRIYPAYLAALIFSILLVSLKPFPLMFQEQDLWKQFYTHLFLIHNYLPSTIKDFNPPFWSLAIEAQLYLIYPVLLILVARLGWRRTLVILAGCEVLIQGTDGLMQAIGAANNIGGKISWVLANSPLGYWFSWSLGAFIADAFLNNKPLPFLKASPLGWLVLAAVGCYVKPLDSFQFLSFAIATAVITSQFLSGARPKIEVHAFSLNILRNIGLWSYSIYLLHYPLLVVYTDAVCWPVPNEYRSLSIAFLLTAAMWLFIMPFCILWYKIFELPAIALGKRIIQRMDIRHGAKVESERFHANARVGVLSKGRYGLMIGTLLIFIVGSYVISAKFIRLPPMNSNNWAWLLATNPDATKRNGSLAVKLAEDACQRTQYQQTVMVGTLAAAYAETGRFEEAISTAQKACALASQSADQELLKRNQELLALYLKHQPYHEAAVRPSDE